ncbi:hypothetical protein [Bdellovibrio sp. HCB337]|uniref:hypothetical protein n=1 Tax=Bdellovibrio sp. HCB337 TaxID=3394358 RepID=UPI0039A4FA06
MKWILLFALFSCSWAYANDGHSVNNGGGVICIDGKCKTLVEAGIEIKPDFQGVWIPESHHLSGVQSLIEKAPLVWELREPVIMQVLGRVNQFRRATVVDPVKLEEIKRQYIEAADNAGFVLDPATFELVAFSSDNTVQPALTYLLPKFFELSPTQQASILLHEGLYRGRPTADLKYVLQFEYAISQSNCGLISHQTNGQLAAYRLGYLNKGQLFAHMLAALTSENADCSFYGGINLGPNALGKTTFSDDHKEMILTLDPLLLLKLGEKDSKFPYIFSRLTDIKFKLVSASYGKVDPRYYMSREAYDLFYIIGSKYIDTNFYTYELENPDQLDFVLPN